MINFAAFVARHGARSAVAARWKAGLMNKAAISALRRGVRTVGVAASVALLAATSARALTIHPFFDPSITDAPNSFDISDAIYKAIEFYDENFSNKVDINIVFRIGPTALGEEESSYYKKTYDDYTKVLLPADLKANPNNRVLATAIPNLKFGNKPAKGKFIVPTSADARALGVAADVGLFGHDGKDWKSGVRYDGVITLSNLKITVGNADVDKISYTRTVLPQQFAANFVIQHEIDEVLGIGFEGSLLGTKTDDLKGSLGPLDLYRYSAKHTPSFTTAITAKSYFSVTGGVKNLINFNQDVTRDPGDWIDIDCKLFQYVQGSRACPGDSQFGLSLTRISVEVAALQAIGYNLLPEPSTWSLMLLGFGGLGAAIRTRRKQALKDA